MTTKIITFLFVSVFAVNCCLAMNPDPQREVGTLDSSSQQNPALNAKVDRIIQSLLAQGYSKDQIVELFDEAFRQSAQQTDEGDKDNAKKKWIALGVGVIVIGLVSWYGWEYYKENYYDDPSESPEQIVARYVHANDNAGFSSQAENDRAFDKCFRRLGQRGYRLPAPEERNLATLVNIVPGWRDVRVGQ